MSEIDFNLLNIHTSLSVISYMTLGEPLTGGGRGFNELTVKNTGDLSLRLCE